MKTNLINRKIFYKKYYEKFLTLFKTEDYLEQLIDFEKEILNCKKRGGTVFILGNGGSAAIASHVAVDLTKNAGVKSLTFNEVDLITCFSNDYGYHNWMKKSLDYYAKKKDLIILISSSGNSPNIIAAAKYSIKKKINLITLTGMSKNNKLKKINKYGLNFWVNSASYNFVENIHQILLLSIVDSLISRKK